MLHHSPEDTSNQVGIESSDQTNKPPLYATGSIEPVLGLTTVIHETMKQGGSANAVMKLIAFLLRES